MPWAETGDSYFLPRRIISDDPFTDAEEESIPAPLGLLISNVGNGIARNVNIVSGQPTIVENDKGLAVEFELVSMFVGGDARPPEFEASLGDLGAGQTQMVLWELTSSLSGTVTGFNATVVPLTDYGDADLALVKSARAHTLTHLIYLTGLSDDGEPDFLADDEAEIGVSYPELVYPSHGGGPEPVVPCAVTDVAWVEEGISMRITASVPELTADSWTYVGAEVAQWVQRLEPNDAERRGGLVDQPKFNGQLPNPTLCACRPPYPLPPLQLPAAWL